MNTDMVLKEIRRKSIHVIPGFLAILFIIWLGRPIAALTALFFFTIYILNEISLRYGLRWRVPIAYHTYMVMARREELEKKTFIGTVYFWGLTLLIILVLPPVPAAAAIMISSLGDAVAAIIGRAYPYPRNPLNKRKSIPGALAMYLVSIGILLLLGYSLVASLIAALIPTLAESATRVSVNDEITVPIAAAVLAYFAYLYL